MTNASDRKSIREAQKRSNLADQNRGEVLVGLMSTVPGREWVWQRLEEAQVFGSPIGTDAYHTYFLLGEQNSGKRLMADCMRFCPDLFIQAMREANERRTIGNLDTSDRTPADELDGSTDPGRDDQGSAVDSDAPRVDDDGQVYYG